MGKCLRLRGGPVLLHHSERGAFRPAAILNPPPSIASAAWLARWRASKPGSPQCLLLQESWRLVVVGRGEEERARGVPFSWWPRRLGRISVGPSARFAFPGKREKNRGQRGSRHLLCLLESRVSGAAAWRCFFRSGLLLSSSWSPLLLKLALKPPFLVGISAEVVRSCLVAARLHLLYHCVVGKDKVVKSGPPCQSRKRAAGSCCPSCSQLAWLRRERTGDSIALLAQAPFLRLQRGLS